MLGHSGLVDKGGHRISLVNTQAYPFAEHREKVVSVDPAVLLPETDAASAQAIRPATAPWCTTTASSASRPVFDLLLGYAISEDGAQHAERYYRTVTGEFATTRPAFRWRQLAAQARVTASEYGRPAPGVAEARRLIGV